MGFGSYDESEQEQPGNDDQDNGEAVTKVGASDDGSDSLEDESVSDMMGHL